MRSFLVIAREKEEKKNEKKKPRQRCSLLTLPDSSWLFISCSQHQRIRAEMRYNKESRKKTLIRSVLSPLKLHLATAHTFHSPAYPHCTFFLLLLLPFFRVKHTNLKLYPASRPWICVPLDQSDILSAHLGRFCHPLECNPVEQKHLKNNPWKKTQPIEPNP